MSQKVENRKSIITTQENHKSVDSEDLSHLSEEPSVWLTAAGSIGRVAAYALASLYAVGLLIVHSSLARYGLETGMDLAKPQYIVVGALWAFLVLSSIGLFRYLSFLPTYGQTRSGIYSHVICFMANLIASLSLPFLLISFFVGVNVAISPKGREALIVVDLNILIVGCLFELIERKRFFTKGGQAAKIVSDPRLYVPTATAAFLFWFVGLGLYSEYCFRILPPEFGGGRHALVMILFEKKLDIPPKIPLGLWDGGKMIGPVEWLFETDDKIVVALHEGENDDWLKPPVPAAVSIRKGSTTAIIYLPKPRGRSLEPFQNGL